MFSVGHKSVWTPAYAGVTAKSKRLVKSWLPAVAAVLGLFGCTIGPRYAPPKIDSPAAFKETSAGFYANVSTDVWRPAQPQDAARKGQWWEIFGDPELNALEEQLNANNQPIAQFFENFMAARAQVAEARASYFPTVTLSPSVSRGEAGSGAASNVAGSGSFAGVSLSGGAAITQYSLPVDASWAPDLWGRVRNAVKASKAAAQLSAADLENERLVEQAALATFFFQLRGQDALQDVFRRTVAADEKSLELTQALEETGIGTDEAVAQAEVTLKTAQAAETGVATNRAIYEHAIATLIGRPASSFSMPVKALSAPVPAFPIGVPSDLLQRRPDVAAAERTMAQANAQIGVAEVAYFPILDLTGSAGFQGGTVSHLVSAPAFFWTLGASAAQTLLDGGLRGAMVAQFSAAYNADVAAYKQTVLTAFQQVEDELSTLRITSQQITRQDEAVESARRFLDRSLGGYQTGVSPYLDVITAQTLLLSNEQSAITLRVTEMTAAVSLVQALGGGWDVRRLPK